MLQMEEHAAQLREELDREREERNYFQLERDKMYSFMEVTQRELEGVKAELTIANNVIEEDERRHQAEIKVRRILWRLKHKVKEILFDIFFGPFFENVLMEKNLRVFQCHVCQLEVVKMDLFNSKASERNKSCSWTGGTWTTQTKTSTRETETM